VPPVFTHLQNELRVEPEDVLRQFREVNPRLRPGMAAIACPRNIFQEIRICMSRDLRDFVPCPQVVQQSCRARTISVRAPL
jgi:ribonuclease T2